MPEFESNILMILDCLSIFCEANGTFPSQETGERCDDSVDRFEKVSRKFVSRTDGMTVCRSAKSMHQIKLICKLCLLTRRRTKYEQISAARARSATCSLQGTQIRDKSKLRYTTIIIEWNRVGKKRLSLWTDQRGSYTWINTLFISIRAFIYQSHGNSVNRVFMRSDECTLAQDEFDFLCPIRKGGFWMWQWTHSVRDGSSNHVRPIGRRLPIPGGRGLVEYQMTRVFRSNFRFFPGAHLWAEPQQVSDPDSVAADVWYGVLGGPLPNWNPKVASPKLGFRTLKMFHFSYG